MHDDAFYRDLSFSRGQREQTDLQTLRSMIPGCLDVEKTGEDLDRQHIDYVAHLRRGAVLHIDGKARREGAKQFWNKCRPGRHAVLNGEPDLAIEVFSVVATETQHAVTGWTLDESSDTDLILYSFDPLDTSEVFLLSFPLLRIAARWRYQEWIARFHLTTQSTTRNGRIQWQSQCCLVPALVVQEAIRGVERAQHCQQKAVSGLVAPAKVQRDLFVDDIKW